LLLHESSRVSAPAAAKIAKPTQQQQQQPKFLGYCCHHLPPWLWSLLLLEGLLPQLPGAW
jgi:hypothetical protein